MEIVGFVRALLQRKAVVAVLLTLATLAAFLTAFRVGPGGVERRSLAVGAATSQILVDSAESTLVEGAGTDQIAALGTRARVYAQYLSSRDAVAQIAKELHLDPSQITAHGPFSQGTGLQDYQQQAGESRARDLVDEGKEYRLLYEAQEDVPIITVYATGPDAEAALGLAHSSFTVLADYIAELKQQAGKAKRSNPQPVEAVVPTIPLVDNIVVRQLGSPEGGLVGGSTDKVMMILAFLAVLGIGCVAIAAASGFMRQWRLAADMEQLGSQADDWLNDRPAQDMPPGVEAPAEEWRLRHPPSGYARDSEHESGPTPTRP